MHRARRPRPEIARSFPLIDIEIERGGDGRTVTAYAATFGDPYEVRDQHGHYVEEIHPAAFNRAVSHGIERFQVLFNHGRTLEGSPSERFSLPLGVPLEVRPDSRGLLTRTRYSRTPLGDEVLQLIVDGAIRAQSFRGAIVNSRKAGIHESGLPIIERTELGLTEYGPAPFAVNSAAAMVAVRSDLLTVDPADLTDEEREALIAYLSAGTAADLAPEGTSAAPAASTDATPEPPADEAPAPGPDVDFLAAEQAQRRRRATT